jgi:hypothetical protein
LEGKNAEVVGLILTGHARALIWSKHVKPCSLAPVNQVLFCYGSLLRDTGPNNILALRTNVPGLLAVAEEVAKRKVVGVAAYKPANSHPGQGSEGL